MSSTDRIAAALDHLGTRTGCEVAKVHALIAIAEAIREAGQTTRGVEQDDIFRSRAYFGGVAYPQDAPAPHLRCQSISGRLQCELIYDHPGPNHRATINWIGP